MNGEFVEDYKIPSVTTQAATESKPSTPAKDANLLTGTNTYRLEDLAYTRSGDKGNHCNIGVCV